MFFEILLPGFLCGTLFGRWDVFPMAGGLLLFCVDILAFAGWTFILMGILERFNLSNKWMIVIAVAMSIIGTFARGFDFGSPILNLFFANFIGSAGGFTAFPLFNWFIFPVAGFVWGQYFIRAKDKGQFFKHYRCIASIIHFFNEDFIKSSIFSKIGNIFFPL